MTAKFKNSCSPQKTGKGCGKYPAGSLNSYKAIVDAYILDGQLELTQMLSDFRDLKHGVAVRYASRGQTTDGKRHLHQRRLKKSTLAEVERLLTSVDLRQYRDFASLYKAIANRLDRCSGVGPLMKYDTALRIGANLGVFPERVYLHSGTSAGAKALGFSVKDSPIERSRLPKEFRSLAPHELEDCLCIFKDQLQEISNVGQYPQAGSPALR